MKEGRAIFITEQIVYGFILSAFMYVCKMRYFGTLELGVLK